MSYDIAQLLQIPILDIAKTLGIVVNKKNAMCFRGHDKKTPSLTFSPEKNLWYCFGCCKGGNNITLIRQYFQYSSNKEAVAWLSQNFTTTISNRDFKINTPKLIKVNPISNDRTFVDSELYGSFISKCGLSEQSREYLRNRGFKEKTVSYFNVKDIIDISKIEEWLIDNYDKKRLLESGLMVVRKGRLCLIWWDHTIIFPVFENSSIIYIQGRRLSNNPPKYMGLLGIPKPLYNKNALTNVQRKGEAVYLCEGIPDTMSATQLGYNAVGVLGAGAFKKEWVDELSRFRIIIVLHGDSAGSSFADKARTYFLEKGRVLEEVLLPKSLDLNDLLKRVD